MILKIINRKKTRKIYIGNVPVGGDSPISVQTMTNTPTTDVEKTIAQIQKVISAGADLVRVSCPDGASTAALKIIAKSVDIPIIADIHFHYKQAIEAAENGAKCLRINPGNIGSLARIKSVVQAAKDYGCAMRIGVNAGSLEKHLFEKYPEPCSDAMVASAHYHMKLLEDLDFFNFKISVKSSNVFMAIEAYEKLSQSCDYPLHIGITEAGSKRAGTVKSSFGLGLLLYQGIGDTLRVSLSADPVEEVKVGFDLLKSLNLRHRGIKIISCPSCARQGFDVIKIVEELEERLAYITHPLTISIIGCVVNGPGEAKLTEIGLTGGGAGQHMIYIAGKSSHKVPTDHIIEHIEGLIKEKIPPQTIKKTELLP